MAEHTQLSLWDDHLTCEKCGRRYLPSASELVANPELRLRFCWNCRRRYQSAINCHHLDLRWAVKLILATHCDFCGRPFRVKWGHRADCVVDHDHACCEKFSCGKCVRGIVHPRCNHLLGVYEHAAVPLNQVVAYLNRG